MKSDFISKLAIKSEVSNSKTSLANEKESSIVYLLFVSGFKNWSRNLASLQLGVPISNKIGRNDGIRSSSTLWTLKSQCRTPGLEPGAYKSFFSFSEISP